MIADWLKWLTFDILIPNYNSACNIVRIISSENFTT